MNDQLPASVQFYDNLDIINAMLKRRFSLRRIWKKLNDDGLYNGDYTHFCRLANKQFDSKKRQSDKTPSKLNTTAAQELSNKSNDSNMPETDEDGPLMYLDDLASPHK